MLREGFCDSFPRLVSDPGGGVREATKTSRAKKPPTPPFLVFQQRSASESPSALRARATASSAVRPSNCLSLLTAAPLASLCDHRLVGHVADRVERHGGPDLTRRDDGQTRQARLEEPPQRQAQARRAEQDGGDTA